MTGGGDTLMSGVCDFRLVLVCWIVAAAGGKYKPVVTSTLRPILAVACQIYQLDLVSQPSHFNVSLRG